MTPQEHLEQAILLAKLIASKRLDSDPHLERRALGRLILLNLKAYLKANQK